MKSSKDICLIVQPPSKTLGRARTYKPIIPRRTRLIYESKTRAVSVARTKFTPEKNILPQKVGGIPSKKVALGLISSMPTAYWVIMPLSIAFIMLGILSNMWIPIVGGAGLLATIFTALRDIREK